MVFQVHISVWNATKSIIWYLTKIIYWTGLDIIRHYIEVNNHLGLRYFNDTVLSLRINVIFSDKSVIKCIYIIFYYIVYYT